MYKVIKTFVDMKDNGHRYEVGDLYPRDGADVSFQRFSELAGNKNRQKTALIMKIDDNNTAEKIITKQEEDGATEKHEKMNEEKPKRGGRKKKAE